MKIKPKLNYTKGKYLSRYKGGTKSREYKLWRQMLNRCYDKDRNEAYDPIEVSCEFLDFQLFADWATNQKGFDLNWELDKDILIKSNKIYSPDTCCFVPNDINMLFSKRANHRGLYPIGVTATKYGKFQSRVSIDGSKIYLGTFEDVETAFNIYKLHKEDYIKQLATYYRPALDPKVYKALMTYQVEITD